MLPAALDAKDVCGLLLTFQAHCVLLMVENSEPPFSLPPFSLAGNISSCLKCQRCLEWVAAVDISSPLLFVDKIVYAKLVSSLLPPFSQAGNIASYLECLWASGLLLIFDNIIYSKFDIWSFLFHCLLFRRLATIPIPMISELLPEIKSMMRKSSLFSVSVKIL